MSMIMKIEDNDGERGWYMWIAMENEIEDEYDVEDRA